MSKPDLLRKYSSIVHDGSDRAPNRSMLRAVGFKDEDFKKTVVGVASTWSMLTPCNMHIDALAREAGAGADAAGGKSMPKKIVLCLDGTSNKYAAANTNVVKLYAMLDRTRPDQLSYYQPGIGTIPPPGFGESSSSGSLPGSISPSRGCFRTTSATPTAS